MGWLLACFGCTKKRKRPKKASKFGPKSRRIRCFQPLESDVLCHQLDSSQALTSSNLNLGEKPKEENNTTRIGKRVRFNLEVTTYELLPADDDDDDYEEGNQNWGEREEEDDDDEQRTRKAFLGYTALSKPASYPSNHRYNNWCDDEDEYHDGNGDVEDELSDLTDDDDDEEEDDDDIPEEYHHIISVPLSSSDDGELVSGNGSTINTRFRSHYVVPVLNPIENLSQWKAVKARRKC